MYGNGNVTKTFLLPATGSASKTRLSFHTFSQYFSLLDKGFSSGQR